MATYKKTGYARKGKKVYKKRNYKRAKITKSFAKKVQKIIHKDTETKCSVYTSNVTAFNQQMLTQADCLRLMPSISLGTSANQRIGNEIRLQSITIRGVITFALNMTAIANTRIGVRLLILKAKRFMDWNAAGADFGTSYSRLLEGVSTGFQGEVSQFNTPINKDYYTCVADKRFYLSQSQTAGGPTTEVFNSTKFVNMKVPYSRRKLNYDDAYIPGESDNYPYFMVIGYSKLDGTAADLTSVSNLTFQYVATAKYEDA